MKPIEALTIKGEYLESYYFATQSDAQQYAESLRAKSDYDRVSVEYFSIEYDAPSVAMKQCCRLMGLKGLHRVYALRKVPAHV